MFLWMPRLCKILAGERVSVEMMSYDLTKGRITFRFK